jgi:IS6 family transposase
MVIKPIRCDTRIKNEKSIPYGMPLRVKKYLNNMIEQDHRFIKTNSEYAWFEIDANSCKMIAGIEAMHMVKKGQLKLRAQSAQNQNRCIHQLFGLTA